MISMKKVVSSFIQDVNEYLSFVTIYGKPNHKYYNFVLNRMGLLYVFVSKSEIFGSTNIATQFVDLGMVSLKNKFLAEESGLNRSAIIFLFCKIYFTDDIAQQCKLRIIADEWAIFKDYIREIEPLPEYETTRIMFFHLYTESFFKFTMKSKALALDYGTVESENDLDPCRDEVFWKDIRSELETLEKCEIVELKQLNSMREEAMASFGQVFQENDVLTETLNDFETVKQAVQEKTVVAAPAKVTQRQISKACRDFLKAPNTASNMKLVEIEEIEWDSDLEGEIDVYQPTTSKKAKTKSKQKKTKTTNESSSSDSDSEINFRKMNRSLGYTTQNIMKGIGAIDNFSEKLKKTYE